MPRYLKEPEFKHGQVARTGVLLINLGTPDAPTAPAVRRYLREFLSDPRVVEIPRLLWLIILNLFVLTTRPKQSAAKYQLIWKREGSPLLTWTRKQTLLLKGYLGERGGEQPVITFGMRYGNPSIAAGLDELKAAGCDKILLLPLYPQYAASTTATACDAAFAHLLEYRNQPAVRSIRSFHDHPGYIAAMAQQVRDYWMNNGRPEHFVMSFHGLPRYTLDRGDPYFCHCQKTARLLASALQLEESEYTVSFQSRFGRARWLEPYTASVLQQLGKAGTQRVDVFCPGFVADCLETLEEIAMEGKQTFLAAGGREYQHIPCLNDSALWIRALADLTTQQLTGWEHPLDTPENRLEAARIATSRSRKMGAKQ
ncbi:ferrochelatase [Amantichitinum ursilacus]|uniref:Ferrochelatase n=1 Tax=Amantichitinum ursilacus TaxID=857265 RepID=A0A0N0XNF5_9NEIS|nr:ferrochelatase [Amantichitinum ursilacus]KPC55132.1 Ferrochelatase [Amantichitinum ursilacus]